MKNSKRNPYIAYTQADCDKYESLALKRKEAIWVRHWTRRDYSYVAKVVPGLCLQVSWEY